MYREDWIITTGVMDWLTDHDDVLRQISDAMHRVTGNADIDKVVTPDLFFQYMKHFVGEIRMAAMLAVPAAPPRQTPPRTPTTTAN